MVHLDINSELDELDREEFFRLKKASFPAVMFVMYTNCPLGSR